MVEFPQPKAAEVHSDAVTRRSRESLPFSICAAAAFGLTVLPLALLLFLVLSLFIIPPPLWLAVLAVASPLVFLPGFALGCFATWECRRKKSLRGVPLAVMGVMAGYAAFLLWWTCFAHALVGNPYASNFSVVIAVIGILWCIVDRSRAPKVVAGVVSILVILAALLSPGLLQQREAARGQVAKESLRQMGIKLLQK